MCVVAETEGTSVRKAPASVAMEEGPSVAKEDGAFVSSAGEDSVARESETFVTEEKGRVSEIARDGVPVSLELGASVARVGGTSVSPGGGSCALSGFLVGSVWQSQALEEPTRPHGLSPGCASPTPPQRVCPSGNVTCNFLSLTQLNPPATAESTA